jgi:protein-disulfide isomerase
MIRKVMMTASLGGMFLLGAAGAYSLPTQDPANQNQTQQATKSITGKVTAIGDAGKSFSMEVSDGSNTKTMQFTVDKNTQVQGQVKAGTQVVVEYQPSSSGPFLAVSVTAQG